MNYELIKILCKRRNLSQNDLIKLSGISSPGFYMGMKKESFTVTTLEKIAVALNVNPCVFFKDDPGVYPEDMVIENIVKDTGVNKSELNAKFEKKPESVELIELMRFKINTLEKELLDLKGNSKPDQ